jgi:hypothetical protein
LRIPTSGPGKGHAGRGSTRPDPPSQPIRHLSDSSHSVRVRVRITVAAPLDRKADSAPSRVKKGLRGVTRGPRRCTRTLRPALSEGTTHREEGDQQRARGHARGGAGGDTRPGPCRGGHARRCPKPGGPSVGHGAATGQPSRPADEASGAAPPGSRRGAPGRTRHEEGRGQGRVDRDPRRRQVGGVLRQRQAGARPVDPLGVRRHGRRQVRRHRRTGAQRDPQAGPQRRQLHHLGTRLQRQLLRDAVQRLRGVDEELLPDRLGRALRRHQHRRGLDEGPLQRGLLRRQPARGRGRLVGLHQRHG